MRKGLIAVLLMVSSIAFADGVAKLWKVSNVAVSTTTPTAIPTTALSGRYKAVIQNASVNYALYVGTSTLMTTANSFIVSSGSGTLEVPIPQGLSIFGLGAANETSGTVDVRLIEYK